MKKEAISTDILTTAEIDDLIKLDKLRILWQEFDGCSSDETVIGHEKLHETWEELKKLLRYKIGCRIVDEAIYGKYDED